MALTERMWLYELLIRFRPDGGVSGAHAKDMEEIVNGDVVVSANEGLAREITTEEFGYLIGARNADMLAQVAAMQADRDAARAEAEEMRGQRDGAEARAEDAEARLAAATGVAAGALSARQLRLGLLEAGITTAQVDAAIDAIADATEREQARIEWEYADSYHRDHPLVAVLGAALGLTDEQIDAMWAAAAAL